MIRAIVSLLLLVLGAVALARGLYLQAELTRQLDTGAMGVIRSWIMSSTTDGRELVAWYRAVTPWLIWGGSGFIGIGILVAIWPEKLPKRSIRKMVSPHREKQKPRHAPKHR